jgi:biotin carboxyl carrier protein
MYEVETGARTRSVRVARAAGGYDVTVDGHERRIDAVPIGRAAWSLLIGGRSYDVGVVEARSGALTVYVNGRMVPVTVGSPVRGRHRGASRGQTPGIDRAGPDPGLAQTLTAPMPGRVVKVLVKAGDAVRARQGLVVVEAMKMENELRAPRAGIVGEVRVAEGALVEAQTVLVVIE